MRILGGGMELSTNQEGSMDVKQLSFSAASELTGEDTLYEATPPRNGYTSFQMLVSHVDVQMPVLVESGGSIPYYYTLRHVYYTQPISNESVIQSCGLDSHYMDKIVTSSKLLGTRDIYRNDVLVCVKTNSTDVCADSDFKWLDVTTSGSESLVATRPSTSNTYQHTSVADSELDCSVDANGIPDMSVGGLALLGELESSLTVSSTMDKSTRTYTAGGKTGSGLKVTMDIIVANQAFIETSGAPLQQYIDSKLQSDVTGSTLVPTVQFIPTYIRHKMASRFAACGNNCSYTERDSAFSASVSVEVTE